MLIHPTDLLNEHLRKLGAKGGKARKKKVSAKRRRQIAKKAARARWKRRKR